jgi:hypothetical protein
LKTKLSLVLIFQLLTLIISTTSCVSINYSFTGAPISAKTISIDYFSNKAALINSSLSQNFTEAMRDKFVNQTKLELVDQNAELQIAGEIVEYSTNPVAIQANEQAALNRLTIVVNVRFENTLKPEESFEQRFSSYYDYDASLSFSSVEDGLVETISEQLVQDIFNKALVNW